MLLGLLLRHATPAAAAAAEICRAATWSEDGGAKDGSEGEGGDERGGAGGEGEGGEDGDSGQGGEGARAPRLLLCASGTARAAAQLHSP